MNNSKNVANTFTKKEITDLIHEVVTETLKKKNPQNSYFIFTYDREPQKIKANLILEVGNRDELKKLIDVHVKKRTELKNNLVEFIKSKIGYVIVFPAASTIIFKSNLSYSFWKTAFKYSQFKKLRYALYPIGPDLNLGLISDPLEIIDNDTYNKDYSKE